MKGREKKRRQRNWLSTKAQVTVVLQPTSGHPASDTGCCAQTQPWARQSSEGKGKGYNGRKDRTLREPTASGRCWRGQLDRVTGPGRQMGGCAEQGSSWQGREANLRRSSRWLPTGFPEGQVGSKQILGRDLEGAVHIYTDNCTPVFLVIFNFDNLFVQASVSLGSFSVLLVE